MIFKKKFHDKTAKTYLSNKKMGLISKRLKHLNTVVCRHMAWSLFVYKSASRILMFLEEAEPGNRFPQPSHCTLHTQH